MANLMIKKPNPKKDKKSSAKQRVLDVYKAQDVRNEQNFQSDLKKALDYDKRVKKVSSWDAVRHGKPNKNDLRQGWAVGQKASGVSEARSVHSKKESGAYSASPALSGGTKKMIKMSKKRARQSDASPQAKRSARRAY